MSRERRVPRRTVTRGARLARAAAPRTARHAGTRLTNLLRDDVRAAELLEQRHREAAMAAATVLGGLKGGAMKVGQLASFVELDAIPEEFRPIYQAELAGLRDRAPATSFADVHRVLTDAWDRPPEQVLEDLEHEPAAAASIGQVHRAVLPGGRRVALKVQHPGVADALETDVRSATTLLRLARAIAPGLDARAVGAELRERLLEELDFELEAGNQRRFARAWRDHPFVVVPDVDLELTRRTVLVCDWVDGAGFDEVLSRPRAERDRFAEILVRFFFALDLQGGFHADPHPGNYLLREDGRVAFLDFGAVKWITRRWRDLQLRVVRAYLAGDRTGLADALVEMGMFRDRADVDEDALWESVRATAAWVFEDRELTVTLAVARRQVELLAQPDPAIAKVASLPPEEVWFRRLEMGMCAVLGRLQATGNWHRMAREWWFGDPPETELGRLHAAWQAGRPLWRAP